jgi:hypothetical protein
MQNSKKVRRQTPAVQEKYIGPVQWERASVTPGAWQHDGVIGGVHYFILVKQDGEITTSPPVPGMRFSGGIRHASAVLKRLAQKG